MFCTDYYKPKITNNFCEDVLKEGDIMIIEALKQMEERIKGHAMECKRLMMHEIKKQGCKCNKPKLEKQDHGTDSIETRAPLDY